MKQVMSETFYWIKLFSFFLMQIVISTFKSVSVCQEGSLSNCCVIKVCHESRYTYSKKIKFWFCFGHLQPKNDPLSFSDYSKLKWQVGLSQSRLLIFYVLNKSIPCRFYHILVLRSVSEWKAYSTWSRILKF